ncbi:WXG100 family type VII secretion target [Nocardia grenadensis]|uniref:WXG100 family type VII secretion target n=1 Tax=Nocardia grenadensis TaxID=931537 RepID=UPI003D8F3DA9
MSNTPDYENPTILGGGEHTNEWEHSEIKAAFSPLLVQDAIDQAERYWQMRQLWEQGVETFIRSTRASLAQSWSGPAAEQSKQAIQDYIDQYARPATSALEALSAGVRNAATAIVETKNAIGDPLTTDGFKGWLNETFNDSEIGRRTEAARVAMQTHYVGRFGELDTQIPVIPVPVGPTSTTDIPALPPGGYDTDTGNPGATTSESPTGTAGETPAGETPGTPEAETPGEAPGEETPESTATDPGDTTTDPGDTATAPASTATPTGTTPTVPAGTTPSGVTTSPGSPGGAPPGGPGSPGTPESPTPGRTVQGAPNTAAGVPAAASAAAANAAANRGMTGMPMGGAGAGRGGQDDESKRSTPDYLINQENTEELLGDIPPTIAGGVIGRNPD